MNKGKIKKPRRKTMEKKIQKIIKTIAIESLKNSANSTTSFTFYQPIPPKEIAKYRK